MFIEIWSLLEASVQIDEAASPVMIRMRIIEANKYFLVCAFDDTIIGYINVYILPGTLTSGHKLTEQTMKQHDAKVRGLIVITLILTYISHNLSLLLGAYPLHSLCGWIGTKMLMVDKVLLLSKRHLLASVGFEMDGESDVKHGNMYMYMYMCVYIYKYNIYEPGSNARWSNPRTFQRHAQIGFHMIIMT
ncbi:hypothetical protein AAMO2058_000669300 [Amorphochlora amoebiformis]